MARSTKRKVNTINISTNEIRDVFNSDSQSKPIPQRVRKASEFFVDGDVDNSIYDNFIESDYCTADEGETKKDKLTRQPYKWGHWRKYGGVEEDISGENGLPEIYFSSIIDKVDAEHVPLGDALKTIVEANGHKVVSVAPDISKVPALVNPEKFEQLNLYSLERSVMFRPGADDALNNSMLAVNVGIDYPNGQQGLPEFQIKVTPYIQEYKLPSSQQSTMFDFGQAIPALKQIQDFLDAPNNLSALFSTNLKATVFSLSVYLESAYVLLRVADYPWVQPIPTSLDKLSRLDIVGDTVTGVRMENGFIKPPIPEDLGRTLGDRPGMLIGDINNASTWAKIADIFQVIGLIIKIILYANELWDMLNPEAYIADGIYQYRNTISDTYTFEDIAGSKYSIGFGRKRIQQTTTKNIYNISREGRTHTFDLNNPNYHLLYSPTNLIPSFPNRTPATNYYMNMEFFPKSMQYDYSTPPPIIGYLVELIPTRHCKLSETKLTKFSVEMCPDKFQYPKFEIQTSSTLNGIPVLYNNTSINFKNAKFVDFIFLKDRDKDWFFGQYYYPTFNADGIYKFVESGYTHLLSYYPGFTGNDCVVIPNDLTFIEDSVLIPKPHFTPPNNTMFDVYFMQEHFGNLLRNSTFKIPQNPDTPYRKYWNFNNNLNIRGGSIYKDSVTAQPVVLTQQIDRYKQNKWFNFKIKLNITSGSIILVTGNSFEHALYRKAFTLDPITSILDPNPPQPIDLEYWGEWNGVSSAEGGIAFNSSGEYHLVLKSTSFSPTGNLTFGFTTDCIGSISEVSLQPKVPIPVGAPTSFGINLAGKSVPIYHHGGRGAYNALTYGDQPTPYFLYKNSNLTSKVLDLLYIHNNENYLDYTYEFSFYLEPNKTATINYYNAVGTLVPPELITNGGEESMLIEKNRTFTDFIQRIEIRIINLYTGSDTELSKILIPEFICNDVKLAYLEDLAGLLVDGYVDISNTSLIDLDCFRIRLKGLTAYNSAIQGRINSFTVPITEYVNLSSTDISGEFGTLINTPEIRCIDNNISSYGIGVPKYSLDTEPYIIWKNCNMSVDDLNYLVYILDLSSTSNGYLDIAGDNPEINDTIALTHIANLITRGWNVLYNAVMEIEVINPNITITSYNTGLITATVVNDNNVPLIYWYWAIYYPPGGFFDEVMSSELLEYSTNNLSVEINTSLLEENTTYLLKIAVSTETEEFFSEFYEFTYNNVEEWTYEGVMTVGESEDLIGYLEDEAGTLTPVLLDFDAIIWDTTFDVFVFHEDYPLETFTKAQINEAVYDVYFNPELGKNGVWTVDSETNPFPPVGQTCEIKLKYTLAEPEPEPEFEEVTIGTQTWMLRNLDVDDGQGGIYAYNDDESNVATYGRLYTWDAAVRVAASIDGWHLPSDAEWTTLTDYLGGADVAGGKLKETGTTHWLTPNTGATNETGFTALPGGYRLNDDGTFNYIGQNGTWWSATEYDENYAYYRNLHYNLKGLYSYDTNKENGFFVRLIKD